MNTVFRPLNAVAINGTTVPLMKEKAALMPFLNQSTLLYAQTMAAPSAIRPTTIHVIGLASSAVVMPHKATVRATTPAMTTPPIKAARAPIASLCCMIH